MMRIMFNDFRNSVTVEKGYKPKYKEGDVLNDYTGNNKYIVIAVYRSDNKKALYDLFDVTNKLVYNKVDVQRLQEIINKNGNYSGKKRYHFLDKFITLYEIERILNYKKGSLVKYLKRKGYGILETEKFLREKEIEYLEGINRK